LHILLTSFPPIFLFFYKLLVVIVVWNEKLAKYKLTITRKGNS